MSSFLAGGPGRTFTSWDPRRAADLGNEVVSFRRTDPGVLEPSKVVDVRCGAGGWSWGKELAVSVDWGLASL